jgi:hypothetical protein
MNPVRFSRRVFLFAVAQPGRDHNQTKRDDREFPEIGTSSQPRKTEGLDDLDDHETDDEERQNLGHAELL